MLMRASQRENRKLRDVARAMIDGSSSGAVDRRVLAADARDRAADARDRAADERDVCRPSGAGRGRCDDRPGCPAGPLGRAT